MITPYFWMLVLGVRHAKSVNAMWSLKRNRKSTRQFGEAHSSTRDMKRQLLGLLACCWFASPMLGQDVDFERRRKEMVRREIASVGVRDPRVLQALRDVPRHAFVPEPLRGKAYLDIALPIGFDQTISSPYIVARMTESLSPQASDRILEIGTGSGYQAAILASMARQVFTVEIVPELGKQARQTLSRLGIENVRVRVGDGYQGWPEQAPFDKIMVTCSPADIPRPLVAQLKEGGQLVIPLGQRFQQVLYRFSKVNGKLKRERVESTFFVPMTGRAEEERTLEAKQTSLVNGSFERTPRDSDEPLNWFYVRGGGSVRDESSPRGERCLKLNSAQSSSCHALQPFGVHGHRTRQLRIEFWVRRENIRTGLLSLQSSQLMVEFYNDARQLVGSEEVSLLSGSSSWQREKALVGVPRDARYGILGVGLFGATGGISFDDVRIEPIETKSADER